MGEGHAPCVASNSFNVVTPTADYPSEYLLTFFNSSNFIAQAMDYSSAYHRTLTSARCREIMVPVAEEGQRDEIVRGFKALKNPDPDKVWEVFRRVFEL